MLKHNSTVREVRVGSPDGPVFNKYLVERADGSTEPGGKHENCKYYVLDTDHDPFAIPALEAYADACEETMPQLASSIRETYLARQ